MKKEPGVRARLIVNLFRSEAFHALIGEMLEYDEALKLENKKDSFLGVEELLGGLQVVEALMKQRLLFVGDQPESEAEALRQKRQRRLHGRSGRHDFRAAAGLSRAEWDEQQQRIAEIEAAEQGDEDGGEIEDEEAESGEPVATV